jgi:hypothetical protein
VRYWSWQEEQIVFDTIPKTPRCSDAYQHPPGWVGQIVKDMNAAERVFSVHHLRGLFGKQVFLGNEQ